MYYDLEKESIVVRLNNDEGINENLIFNDMFEYDTENTIVQWITDSLYYISPINGIEFDKSVLESICLQLDGIEELIDNAREIAWNEEEIA